jgi:streptogramin lyase
VPHPRPRALIPAVLLLAACSASTSPSGSEAPSEAALSPSAAASAAPSGPPSEDVEDAATLEIRVEGGPDWPTELAGSLWILAPDGPLGPPGSGAGGDPYVLRLDPATGEQQGLVVIPGRLCQGMTAAFESLWACGNAGIVRIDPATNAVVDQINYPVPLVYGRPAVGPDALWVLSGDIRADQVARIDPVAGELAGALVPLGHAATSLTYAFDALWATAAADGMLLRIDPETGAVTEHAIDLPAPSAVSAGAGSLWVLLYGIREDGPEPGAEDPVVARIDPESADVTLVGPVGRAPHEGDILATDDAVWVRGQVPLLARIDPATNEVDRIVTGNFGGGSLGLGSGSVWTTSVEFGRVWSLAP